MKNNKLSLLAIACGIFAIAIALEIIAGTGMLIYFHSAMMTSISIADTIPQDLFDSQNNLIITMFKQSQQIQEYGIAKLNVTSGIFFGLIFISLFKWIINS
ncbi:MAG: hypothetical protein F6K50_02585 [Moorea sp. SIO3I7]|nr:hypothetical protein [Moorena sp. SIO3I7]